MYAAADLVPEDGAAITLSLERGAAIGLAPDAWARRRGTIAIVLAALLHAGLFGALLFGSLARDAPIESSTIPVEIVADPKPPPPGASESAGQELPAAGEQRDHAVGSPPDTPTEPSPQPAPLPSPDATAEAEATDSTLAAPEPPAPEAAPPAASSTDAIPAPPDPAQALAALAPLPVPRAKPEAPPPRAGTGAASLLHLPPAPARDQIERRGESGGVRYIASLKECISRKGRYPPSVRALGISGTTQYEVTIDRRGRLLRLQLVKSSGFGILNETGAEMIKPCFPFEPLTADIAGQSVTVVITLRMPP